MTILVHSDWDGLSDHLRDIPWGYFLHLPSLFWSCIYNIHIISIYLYLCVFFISIYLSIYLSIYIYIYVYVYVFINAVFYFNNYLFAVKLKLHEI